MKLLKLFTIEKLNPTETGWEERMVRVGWTTKVTFFGTDIQVRKAFRPTEFKRRKEKRA